MTIRTVKFHQTQWAAHATPDAVRISGTNVIIKIELVPENSDYGHLLEESDLLVGWLDVELVVARPRDIEGLRFDVVAIARDPPFNS